MNSLSRKCGMMPARMALLLHVMILASWALGGDAQNNNTDTTSCTGDIDGLGNGLCEFANNNEGCGYDGGDCCECTCAEKDCGTAIYFCVDPTSGCVDPRIDEFPDCTDGWVVGIGDGHCDSDYTLDNNNEACGFDGGDCCECTCVDGSNASCEESVFFCVDPSAPCYDPDAAVVKSTCMSEDIGKIGNGYCDFSIDSSADDNNNEACGFDGGDCCECTCVDGPSNECGDNGFHCLDPNSGCIDPRVAEYPDCTDGWVPYIGDGVCHFEINNKEECGFDGGDCCECTCTDGDGGSCGDEGFICMDPTALCYDPDAMAVYLSCTNGMIDRIGDGQCDFENNNEICGYDGGDCCDCTCISGAYASCDPRLSFCIDPSAPCYDQDAAAMYLQCTEEMIEDVGNGKCDPGSNLEGCRFDGGDCCACTCVGDSCASSALDCIDPSGSGTALYNCESPPPALIPCPANRRFEWVVENTIQALAVAEAVNCSGGMFNVEWKGNVVVNKTIVVAGDTVLNVTGVASGGTIDGGSTTRLFTVVNASLHLSNVNVSSGYATYGGALAASGSNLTFHRTAFIGNTASKNGGALLMMAGSVASFWVETEFRDNIASEGAGLYVSGGCSLSWEGKSTFLGNTADTTGGALRLTGGSVASWSGDVNFSHNIADWQGGALYMINASASWAGEAVFSNNEARSAGGALYMSGTVASWARNASFINNTSGSEGGGALRVTEYSFASWAAEALFSGNEAQHYGGALFVSVSSGVKWSNKTTFSGNTANQGGALYAIDGSDASWAEEAIFVRNNARENGGGLLLRHNSRASWNTTALFLSNTAVNDGGAVYVVDASNASTLGETTFHGNSADVGGALLITDGSTVELLGETSFSLNIADSDGGAVGSELFSSTVGIASLLNNDDSLFLVRGATNFKNNTCGGNGGAVALLGTLYLALETTDVTFSGNTAAVSGGAVFISSTGIGPEFIGTTFVWNSAQVGGGVYATGSGTVVTLEILSSSAPSKVSHPTTFDGCTFVGNSAKATGGAVDSASGEDEFLDTTFEGNSAGVGGALRLGGKASVDSCLFIDNVSDESGGPAVSNIGFISDVVYSYFSNNVFSCEPGKFLEFIQSGDPFSTVCDGCSALCQDCIFETRYGVPHCITLAAAGVENAHSSGGVVTVEDLVIKKGYWRATATSTSVLECYNGNACLGGFTTGSCAEGYEGPYCAICSEHYVGSLGHSCGKCCEAPGGIALAVMIAISGSFTAVAVISYLMSGDMEGRRRGLVHRIARRVPLQTIKIIVVSWQILTQFASVVNVTYPDVYQSFLDGVDFLNFDLSWVLSVGCILELDFYDRLLLTTLGPIVAMLFLCGTYAIAVRWNRGSEVALRNVRYKHVSMALLVTFLVYSSVSSVVFQMFVCEGLDNNKTYLRADYSIECNDPKHKSFMIYASVMIFVYPVGIPALYAYLLFTNRDLLHQQAGREESFHLKATSNLWQSYKPSRYYYEVIECSRRILLAGVVVFIFPNTAAQIAITLIIALLFVFVSEGMAPYESPWDTWVSRTGHAVVFISMYLALLLKVNVSGERYRSQKAFETILVCIHVCMVLAVVTEAILMACGLSSEQMEGEDASVRFKCLAPWFFKKDTPLLDFGKLSRKPRVELTSFPSVGSDDIFEEPNQYCEDGLRAR